MLARTYRHSEPNRQEQTQSGDGLLQARSPGEGRVPLAPRLGNLHGPWSQRETSQLPRAQPGVGSRPCPLLWNRWCLGLTPKGLRRDRAPGLVAEAPSAAPHKVQISQLEQHMSGRGAGIQPVPSGLSEPALAREGQAMALKEAAAAAQLGAAVAEYGGQGLQPVATPAQPGPPFQATQVISVAQGPRSA